MRRTIDTLAGMCGLLRVLEGSSRLGCTVLMYHRVLPDDACNGYPLKNLVVPLSVFEAQVAWLSAHCRVQTVAQALRSLGSRGGKPQVCLTFDDGYWDNSDIAAPVLERAGVRATFYVATDFVERRVALWFDTAARAWGAARSLCERAASEELGRVPGTLEDWLAALKGDAGVRGRVLSMLGGGGADEVADRGMTIEDAHALAARGHELGAHTMSHPILTQLDDGALRDEVEGSVRRVREWTGQEHVGFAYPNGSFDARVREAVIAGGASHACTTVRGRHRPHADAFAVNRRAVFPASVTRGGAHDARTLRAEIFGLHDTERRVLRRLRGVVGGNR